MENQVGKTIDVEFQCRQKKRGIFIFGKRTENLARRIKK